MCQLIAAGDKLIEGEGECPQKRVLHIAQDFHALCSLLSILCERAVSWSKAENVRTGLSAIIKWRLKFGIVKIHLYIYNENKEEAGKGDNFVKVFQTTCIFPVKRNDSNNILLFLSCLFS